MASLNTLRTRGGWIISIVIGFALIAFLLGDFAPRSCGDHSVGSIAGNKIDYPEFYNASEKYTFIFQSMYRKSSLTAEERDQVRDMTWNAMIMEYAYLPGLKKLGIIASGAEEADMVGGVYTSPVIAGMFPNPQTGQLDMDELRKFKSAAENDPSGNTMVIWEYIKQQMKEQRIMSKYIALVSKGMFVNDLEVNAGVEAENNDYNVRLLSRSYSLVADSVINVTNSDIKAYYNNHKNKYKQQASREIEYVVFDMLPSESDYEESKKYVDELASEFALATNPMQFAVRNSQIRPDQRFLTESQVTDPAIAAAVYGKPNAIYGPVLANDVYTIARQGEVKMIPDTIGAKHILLPETDKKLADSLVNAIKTGADFAELARQYSNDPSAANNGGDLGKFTPEQMVPEFSEACIEAKKGDVFLVNSDYGLHIVELTYKTTPVRKAQIAILKYAVEPSEDTRQKIYAEASNFVAEATGSYENFNKAANEAVLAKRVARISNTDRNVSGLSDSHNLVQWAFTSPKGTVSSIMEVGNDYVIAALTDARETGIASLQEVADQIRPVIVRQKKGEILAKELEGSNLTEIAQKLGTEIVEANNVKFSDFTIENVMGSEQKLIGAICSGLETGKVSKPVKGNLGVYVFEVDNVNREDNATPESERVKQESMFNSYFIGQRASQAMMETSNIKDNRVKYF